MVNMNELDPNKTNNAAFGHIDDTYQPDIVQSQSRFHGHRKG